MKPKFTEEERKLIGRRIRDSRNAEKYTLEQQRFMAAGSENRKGVEYWC